MADYISFNVGQGIQAQSGTWYNNVQHLGTGGNSVVFLVHATSGPHIGVLFALKVFFKVSAPERRERFLEEISFLQRCDHPSVMRVYDSGVFHINYPQPQDHPFVIADYLPLRLYDVMRSGTATIPERVSYARQLLSALHYLSSLDPQVIHRDIKPQNIFVKGGSCVLGDFGLMKLLDGENELDREIFKESIEPGMPFFYRTPDLVAYARGESGITVKSDVFQLGLVLAELFTGRNPARRPKDVLDPVDLELLGKIPGSLSGAIATLINRMLRMDTGKRPSVDELLKPWEGIFESAVEKSHELDGRVL